MILLIHGNAGVGKSTTAHLLHEHIGDESIVLEVDKLRYNVVDDRIDTDTLDLCDQQVMSAAEAFLESMYDTVIIEGVYPSQKHLRKVVDKLQRIDSDVYVYRLECSLRENIQRDKQRDDAMTVGETVRTVYETFHRLDHDAEVGYVVDTTGHTPNQTVKEIEELIDRDTGKLE
jgi:broad-specificity NMP kinase